MSAATMNEMERLRRERDEARAERDALAAHVERLTSVAEKLSTIAPEYLDHLAADANFVLRDAPATSLARLKAEWGAEAISRYASQHLGGTEQELAEIYAGKLRRQAETHQHGG